MAKKILYVASSYIHLMNFHLPYLRALSERGWEVHAVCGDTRGDIPYAARTIVVPFKKKMSAPDNFRAALQLRRLARWENYELVIVHTSLAAFFTRLALKGLRRRPKLVNMVHGYLFDDDTPSPKRRILLAAEKLTARQTDLVLTMNAWDEALARREKLGARIGFVPGVGVDFKRFAAISPEKGRELRRTLGIADGNFVLLYAAELSVRKSQSLLIRALAELPESCRLVLAGNGAERESCEALCSELGLADRVLFPGHVSNIGDWLSMADAVVSTSRSEGLPFNIMEAMAMHKCVAASAVKGHTDLLEDGRSGLLFPYGDVSACAAAIRRLMDDGALRESIADEAQRDVEQYRLERVFPLVMAEYESLLPQPVTI